MKLILLHGKSPTRLSLPYAHDDNLSIPVTNDIDGANTSSVIDTSISHNVNTASYTSLPEYDSITSTVLFVFAICSFVTIVFTVTIANRSEIESHPSQVDLSSFDSELALLALNLELRYNHPFYRPAHSLELLKLLGKEHSLALRQLTIQLAFHVSPSLNLSICLPTMSTLAPNKNTHENHTPRR